MERRGLIIEMGREECCGCKYCCLIWGADKNRGAIDERGRF